jgi:hypothetical protein
VPASTAWLAEVGARDPHPPELGGRGDHFSQQLAVSGLDPGALSQIDARLGDKLGQIVAQLLELAEVEDPRRHRARGDTVI